MLFDRRVQFEFEKRHDEIQYAELNRGEAILASLQQLAPEEAAREVLDLSAEELRAVLASALYDKSYQTVFDFGPDGRERATCAEVGPAGKTPGKTWAGEFAKAFNLAEIERGLGDDPDSPQPGD